MTLAIAAWVAPVHGQIADQVMVFAIDAVGPTVVRYSPRLELLSATSVLAEGGLLGHFNPIATDAQGRYWVTFDALYTKKLLRLDSAGNLLLPSVLLGHNPVNVVVDPAGTAFVLTRIPLSTPGPMYSVSKSGSILWINGAGPALFTILYPELMALTPSGELWMGDSTNLHGWLNPLICRIDPATGDVLQQLQLPSISTQDTFLNRMVAAPDGTLWCLLGALGPPNTLVHTDGQIVLGQYPIKDGGYNGFTNEINADAAGNILAVSASTPAGNQGANLLRLSGADGTLLDTFDTGGPIRGYALSANGECAYVVILAELVRPFSRRLVRINLVSGARSSVPLDPDFTAGTIALGDPTGFVYANVVDQAGDNDGDGAMNREETLAGSNPFDPLSRPEGPKVYVSFQPTTNALVLTYVDADGLLDPSGGLDLSTLSVTIGNFGNVFWLLAPFATALDLTPDGKQATLTYGSLPLPLDKKWQVEATIADLTGATGWDWQVTPPGDL